MSREYIAFISYRHTPLDMKVAKTLHSVIEQYRVPKAYRRDGKKRLGVVFRDQEELPVSSDLSKDICTALDHSEFLVVVCTPDTPQSIWVQREIEYFLQSHPRENVLTVLASGQPTEAFPYTLTHKTDPETGENTDTEPLAADVRGETDREVVDNVKKESLRLFAAMLGCPYDALVMREQRRRRKRIAAVAAVALIVVCAFLSLSVIKNIQLQDKNVLLETQKSQLETQKSQLEAQKADILLRESELLTMNAQTAFDNEEMIEAVRLACRALTTEDGGERPYYAPAESVLMQALDIFDERFDDEQIDKMTLTQETPITTYAVSPSGQYLFTTDDYGSMIMYDAFEGTVLWEKQVADTPSSDCEPVFIPQHEFVIVCTRYDIIAYRITTGERVWTHDFGGIGKNKFAYVESTPVLSPDGTRFMYLCKMSGGKVTLVEADVATGQTVAEYTLPDSVVPLIRIRFTLLGQYSPDGTAFFFGDHERREDVYYSVFRMVDLTDGTVKTLYEMPEDTMYHANVFSIHIDEERHTAAFCADYPQELLGTDNYELQYILIDYVDGRVIAETLLRPESGASSLVQNRGAVLQNDRVLLYTDRSFYIVDAPTGSLLLFEKARDEIRAVEPLSPGADSGVCVSVIYGDGTLSARWTNGERFASREGGALSVGSGYRFAHGGVWEMTDTEVDTYAGPSMRTGNETNGLGYIACVSEEDSHTLVLTRVVEFNNSEIISNMQLRDQVVEKYLCGETAVVFETRDDDGKGAYVIADVANKQALNTLPVNEELPLHNDICFLPDGKGYVEEGSDKLWYCDENGEQHVLMENEKVDLASDGDNQFIVSRYGISIAPQSGSSDVVAACCNGDTLTTWINGQQRKDVAVPDDIRWYHQTRTSRYSMLQVGQNGYILLSHHDLVDLLNTEHVMSHFVLYNMATDEFIKIADAATGSQERVVGMADSKAMFAVCDEDGQIRIYSAESREMTNEFSLVVPWNSVIRLEWIVNDTAVAVITEDNQLLIYSVADGSLLYRQVIEDLYFKDQYPIAYHEATDRVVVSFGNAAVIIDAQTWTTLMTVKENDVLYFPAINALLKWSDAGTFSMYNVPTTEQLITLGQRY